MNTFMSRLPMDKVGGPVKPGGGPALAATGQPSSPPPPTTNGTPPATTLLQRNANGAPINPYNMTDNKMPNMSGTNTPIGAFGAQWGGSGYETDPSQNPHAAEWLHWMQQSDPSAHFSHNTGSDGGADSWSFQQDHPGAEGVYPQLQQMLKPYGGGQTLDPVYENVLGHEQPHAQTQSLKNPDMTLNTPMGHISPTANVNQPSEGWFRYAGAIPALAATIMSGGAASPMLIQAMNSMPGLINAISSGHIPWQQLVSMAGGAAGLPSYATGAINAGIGLATQGGKRPGG